MHRRGVKQDFFLSLFLYAYLILLSLVVRSFLREVLLGFLFLATLFLFAEDGHI